MNSDLKEMIPMFVMIYMCLCLLGSFFKALPSTKDIPTCDKTYPIDYVIYTNLFCEIKKEEKT